MKHEPRILSPDESITKTFQLNAHTLKYDFSFRQKTKNVNQKSAIRKKCSDEEEKKEIALLFYS